MNLGRQHDLDAISWALDQAEQQLRDEPAHRLRDQGRLLSWSFSATDGTDLYVETTQIHVAPTEVQLELSGRTSGLFRRRCLQRRLIGHAARMPEVLFLVFEEGGFVYAFESLEEAGETLEAIDLLDGHYVGAFSDRGEVIAMEPAELWIKFTYTGRADPARLTELIKSSNGPPHLIDEPHHFALDVWLRS